LHAYKGLFVYEHTQTTAGTVFTDAEKTIRNKVLYTLVSELTEQKGVNLKEEKR